MQIPDETAWNDRHVICRLAYLSSKAYQRYRRQVSSKYQSARDKNTILKIVAPVSGRARRRCANQRNDMQ